MFAKSALLVVLATAALVTCFPDGAPADTCVREPPNSTNTPKHGKTLPMALNSIPYRLVASGDQFGPGAEIQSE